MAPSTLPFGHHVGWGRCRLKWGSVGVAARELALLDKRKSGESDLGTREPVKPEGLERPIL